MALDFALVNADGAPVEIVGIRLLVHDRLIARARSSDMPLLLRTEDFYADAEFLSHEVLPLLTEVRTMQQAVLDDLELSEALALLGDLASKALATESGIVVSAD